MAPPKGHAPYPGCETGGRPTIYTDDVVTNLTDLLLEWMQTPENIFIERFCYEYDLPEDDIARVLVKHDKFLRAYKKLKTKQKYSLFEGSLKRRYSHNMCALVLSHSHGIYLKEEKKLSGDAENPLSFLLSTTESKQLEFIGDANVIGTSGSKHTVSQMEDEKPLLDYRQAGEENKVST